MKAISIVEGGSLMAELTPGMRQYLAIKEQNPDCVVLFRMGDFYETFYEDAKTAARVLGITLTSRGQGVKKAPLAGIPYHALEPYLKKLVKNGHKVALVEQLEDPKKAKGLVKRGLVRIVTPGTIIEDSMLASGANNYILAISKGEQHGLAACDISTGEFKAAQFPDEHSLRSEIERFQPSEIIMPVSQEAAPLAEDLKRRGYHITAQDDRFYWKEKALDTIKEQFHVATVEGFGIEGKDQVIAVCGALLSYIRDTQKNSMSYLQKISYFSREQYMDIDASSLRNLELLKNIRDGTSRGTLFDVINKTCTSMGQRKLRSWLIRPLLRRERITQRHDAVGELMGNTLLREELREILQSISDIERIISRVTYGSANARDLVSLKDALLLVPDLKRTLLSLSSPLLQEISRMDACETLAAKISESILPEPQATLREGNLICKGYSKELDDLRERSAQGKRWIASFEESEKQRTGIKSLKVKYNRVFGYFIEVTNNNLRNVPEDYIRKQTQANAERFITEDLKEKESLVLGAQEKINALEYDLFLSIIGEVIIKQAEVQDIARSVARLDALLSLSQAAAENRYARPEMTEGFALSITKGRHPVVERMVSAYVPNDTSFGEDSRIHIITGPNMAGKSTYLRQVALIAILSQMGSFVPAEKASLPILDRVFTRVGAVDDLSQGKSTFMVEMVEVATIVNNATEHSLIIMDEVGRGTSTYDGLSLAWAITEYIDERIKAKTLFATHYHQLNKLATTRATIKNFNISVSEHGGDVIFLHRIAKGGTDKSYGIHVARLAGLPDELLMRAKVIQGSLEEQELLVKGASIKRSELRTDDVKKRKDPQIQRSLLEVIGDD